MILGLFTTDCLLDLVHYLLHQLVSAGQNIDHPTTHILVLLFQLIVLLLFLLLLVICIISADYIAGFPVGDDGVSPV